MTDYSYIGVGKVHIRERGAAAPLAFVGNVSTLDFAVEEEKKTLKDYTQGGGGNYNEQARISSVNAEMTAHDLSASNLARAIRGTVTAVAAGAVSNENVGEVYASGISPTAYPINTTVAPVVKHAQFAASARANTTAYDVDDYYLPATPNGYVYKCTVAGTSAGSPPSFSTTLGATFADGTATFRVVGITDALTVTTHYEVSGGGITFTASPSIYDGEEAIVSYTKAAADTVEALLHSGKEYELFFDGLNDAQSGEPVLVWVYRWKMGATDGLSLIGDDFWAGKQAGEILKDTTKNGTTLSQYFRVQIVRQPG